VATATINASYQAVATLNGGTMNDEALWDPALSYTVPSKGIRLGVAPAGTPPGQVTFGPDATLGDGDAFDGSVDVSTLAPGDYEVYARACFASNCAVTSAPFTVS